MIKKMRTRFQFCFVETAGVVKRWRLVVNGKVPQHTPFHFLSHQQNLGFLRFILKCDSEPSTKSLRVLEWK